MRKEFFIHFAFWFSFFVLISIFRNQLSIAYWPFWLGGILGTIVLDVDHLIYIFLLNPHELTSQRVNFLIKRKEIGRAISLLYETRNERNNLVFHTFLFQILLLILTFLMVSSSNSLFVIGMVLSLSFHLIIDQLADLTETKSLNNWGKLMSTEATYKKLTLYIFAVFLLVCIMGILM